MKMKIQLVRLPLVLGGLLVLFQPLQAQCHKVSDKEFAHGANEVIQLPDRTMTRIRGQVFFPHNDSAKDIIVELYDYPSTDTELKYYQVPDKKTRLTACLTKENGKFSFKRLKPGRYLLRAGTRKQNQFNHVYIVITVDPKSEENPKENLEIALTLGT